MIVINRIQKAIYDCLKAQNSENFQVLKGIFNYLDKNTDFPYIFVNINNVEDLSTFSKNIYSCSVSINIFDKNTTNGFVVNLADEIKDVFYNLNNFDMDDYETDNFEVIDIKFENFKITNRSAGCRHKFNIFVFFLSDCML